MKKLSIILSTIAVLLLGVGIGCLIKCNKPKVAVVDMLTIVNKSAQVEALKNEQTAKTQELMAWLQSVQEEVKKEKNSEKQEELLKKHNEEFTAKREEMANQYNTELQKIDSDITSTIIEVAKQKGFSLVVAKGVVVYGGVDITEDVAKVVK